MRCPDCDTRNAANALSCSACGKDLPTDVAEGESDIKPTGVAEARATVSLPDAVSTGTGGEVDSAYEPSGNPGNVPLLMMFAILATLAGIGMGAVCAGGAVLLNLLHNLLPAFVFLLPVVVLLFLAMSPGVFGLALGWVLARGAFIAKSRNPAVAGFVGLACAAGSIMLVLTVAESVIWPGTPFLDEVLVQFVRLMVGGAINFSWLEAPEAVNVPVWIVHSVLGLSTLLALLFAFMLPYDRIRSTPFCEQCGEYLRSSTLWSVSAVSSKGAIRAFDSLDIDAMSGLPECKDARKRIRIDLWQCGCRQGFFLDLMEETTTPPRDPKGKPDVNEKRIFSKALNEEQMDQVCSCRRGAGNGAYAVDGELSSVESCLVSADA